MGLARGTVRSLCVVSLLLTGWALPAQSVAQGSRNIAPLHREWMDGAACRGGHDILATGGYDVSIAGEPLSSFRNETADGERFRYDFVRIGDLPAPSWGGSPSLEGRRPPRERCDQAGEDRASTGRVPDRVLRMVVGALLQRVPGGELAGAGLGAMAGFLPRPQLPRGIFAPHP